MEIHRMFDTQDKFQNVHQTKKGQEPGQQGIKSLDMSKMNPVRAFFARLLGTTVHVGGKEYLVGKKSAAAFLSRNGVDLAKTDSKSIVAGITKYYNDQVKEKSGKMESAKDTDTMQVSKADLKLVLKAIGLNDATLLKELDVVNPKRSKKPGDDSTLEAINRRYINKSDSVTLTKQEFIEVLKKHVKEIKDSKEFPEVANWLRSAIAGKPVDPVDDSGSPKGGSAVKGSDELPPEEKRTELRGTDAKTRMKDAVDNGIKINDIKDEAGAKEFLQDLIQNLKVDRFKEEARHELTNNLNDYRNQIAPAHRGAFDAVVRHLGYEVKGDHLVDTRLHKK